MKNIDLTITCDCQSFANCICDKFFLHSWGTCVVFRREGYYNFFLRLESLKQKIEFREWNIQSLWGKSKNLLESLKGKVGFHKWNVQSLWGKSENLWLCATDGRKLRATDIGKLCATNGGRGGRRQQNMVFLCLWV